jgi:hypothetical protein
MGREGEPLAPSRFQVTPGENSPPCDYQLACEAPKAWLLMLCNGAKFLWTPPIVSWALTATVVLASIWQARLGQSIDAKNCGPIVPANHYPCSPANCNSPSAGQVSATGHDLQSQMLCIVARGGSVCILISGMADSPVARADCQFQLPLIVILPQLTLSSLASHLQPLLVTGASC